MKQLNQVTKVVAKVLEIVHWVAAALMLAAAIVPHLMTDIGILVEAEELTVYGLEMTMSVGELTTLRIFAIGAVILYILMAMIFRNINLIMKKSENDTPFQKDNVRMVREIGIFSIAVPVVGLIVSIITRLVVGVDATETSVDFQGFIMGLVVLSLSQFFAHGVALEQDVDGLV